jgi:hypothetical protein
MRQHTAAPPADYAAGTDNDQRLRLVMDIRNAPLGERLRLLALLLGLLPRLLFGLPIYAIAFRGRPLIAATHEDLYP